MEARICILTLRISFSYESNYRALIIELCRLSMRLCRQASIQRGRQGGVCLREHALCHQGPHRCIPQWSSRWHATSTNVHSCSSRPSTHPNTHADYPRFEPGAFREATRARGFLGRLLIIDLLWWPIVMLVYKRSNKGWMSMVGE